MKKNIFAVLAILIASFSLYSCSSDDKDENLSEVEQILNLPYSQLSPADQKKKLANEGKATAKQLEGLSNEKSTELIASFEDLSEDLLSLLDGIEALPVQKAANSIIKLSQYHGEYSWNNELEDWEKQDTETDKLILNLPAKKGGVANNGKIEITAYTSTVNINGREIPSNVIAELFVADKKEGEVTAIATGINEIKYVDTADVNAYLGGYTLAVNVDKKGMDNTSKVELMNGNELILDAFVDLEANITVEMIEEEDVSSVKDANFVAHVAKDLAAAGYVDGKKLIAEIQRIDKEDDKLWGTYWEDNGDREKKYLELERARVAAYNAYSNIALASTTEIHKIAKITAELFVEEYESIGRREQKDAEGNVIMNEWGNPEYEDYDYISYETEIIYVLNFDDKTKVEAEVFFSEGFDEIMNVWKDIFNKFQ